MTRSLNASDFVVLAMIACGAQSISGLVGLTHPLAVWSFALAWTCPAARRLMAWRRRTLPARQFPRNNVVEAIRLLALVLLPWAFFPLVGQLDPSRLDSRVAFPDWLRWTGTGLILGGVLRPLWRGTVIDPETAGQGEAEAVGLLLLTASPVLAVMSGCGLALKLSSPRRPLRPPVPTSVLAPSREAY